MFTIQTLIAAGVGIAALVCWIIILIDAFQDELWKGLLGLFCSLYLLYYAIFDFDHDNKLLILLMAFGGSAIATGILNLGH